MLRALSKAVTYTILFISLAALGAHVFGGLRLPFNAADLLIPVVGAIGAIALLRSLEKKRMERAIDHYFWRQEFDAMARKRAKSHSDDSGIWPQQVGA